MLQTRFKSAISPAALAWYGNAAKMRIIERIAADGTPKTILDYGAGEGRGWRSAINERPEIRLICYEPNPASARALRRRNVGTVYDRDPADITEQADVIVSFSVFEHVHDRAAYLAHARRLLKPGGRFFLNYDDGHFRAPGSRKEALRNKLAPVLPKLGMVGHYQARVIRDEADALIEAAGFTVAESRYENLRSFKTLAKTIPEAQRADFAAFWLQAEDRLNTDFMGEVGEYLGDSANLWREMGSRTLELI